MRQGLVMVAMCLAGAVGAVTFDWTDANKVGSSFAGGDNGSINALSTLQVSNTNATTLFGAIVKGNYPGGTGNRVIFGVGNGTDKGASNLSAISVSISVAGALSLWYNGSGNNPSVGTQVAMSSDSAIPAGIETKLVLQLVRNENSLTASLFMNDADSALASGTVENFGSNKLDYLYVGDYYGASGGAKYGAATSVQAYALPEPGTLALLALGVAGLALRRKVA